MEISTALIFLIVVVFLWIGIRNEQKKRERTLIKIQERKEEERRFGKRFTLFRMMEEDVINESQMNWGEKYELKSEFEIDEEDFDEASKHLSRWIWVKLTVFDRCMRLYPEFFDREHSQEFVDEIREDFQKRFPDLKIKYLKDNIEDWGPND